MAFRLTDIVTGAPLEEVFRMLEARIDDLESYIKWEEELRKQNPALQDLYEKYQVTKQLVGNDNG